MNLVHPGLWGIGLTLVPVFSCAQSVESQTADEVVVTATRFEESPQDLPVGVSIITADQIQRSGVLSLPQLLARQPGIMVRDNSGSPDQQVDMRGFGATGDQNTLVLVDGQRLSDNELSPARWSTVPLEAIERIEILRGSGAVPYGGGATGGVINIITKRARPGQRTANAYVGYGSYDTLDLRAGGSLAGDRLGLTLNGGHYSSDNYRDHNRVLQRNVEARLETLVEGSSVALNVGLDDQQLQLPGARTEAQLETDRRGATTPNDFANRDGGHAALTGRIDLGFGELVADVGYRKKDVTSSVFFLGDLFNTNTRADVWSVTPRLKAVYGLMGAENTLVAGVDLDWWAYDSTRDFGSAHISASQTNQAVYIQHGSRFSAGTVISLGGRLQEVNYDARDENSGAAYANQSKSSRPSAYEVAAKQELGSAFSVYGKLGRSFRVATVDEIYNQFGGPFFDPIITFLEPQTSNDREAGVEHETATTYSRAALYYMTLNNEIHFDPITFTNVNLPPTKRYGAELEGRWRARRWAELYANYTYAVAEFRSATLNGADVTGKTIPLVPRHRFNIGTNIDFSEATRLNVVFSYVGTQFFDGDESNTFGRKIPAFRTVDVRLSHRVGDWTVAGTVINLFNEKYFTYGLVTGSTFIAYPQPEQAAFVSLEYRYR